MEVLQGDSAQGPGQALVVKTSLPGQVIFLPPTQLLDTRPLAPPTGHGGEVLHAVLHPEAHPAVGGDPPRGEAVPTARRQHVAASPQPERPGGGGVQATQGTSATVAVFVILKVLARIFFASRNFQFHSAFASANTPL